MPVLLSGKRELQPLRDSRILVTGHQGFIGSRLCQKLSEAGLNFRGYDARGVLVEDINHSVLDALGSFRPQIIFHMGANSDTLDQSVNDVMVRNFLVTDTLSEWALKNNARHVYSSSAASYGVSGGNPSNLYGWSKYTAERLTLARGGLALRYFNVYGPGEERKGKMASFAFQALSKHSAGLQVQLFPGDPVRDFIHVDDVVSANLFALDNYQDLSGHWFDVGTGVATSFESVLITLGIPWGYEDTKAIPKGYQNYTRANPQHFMPGWRPRIFIEQGMSEYKNYLDASPS